MGWDSIKAISPDDVLLKESTTEKHFDEDFSKISDKIDKLLFLEKAPQVTYMKIPKQHLEKKENEKNEPLKNGEEHRHKDKIKNQEIHQIEIKDSKNLTGSEESEHNSKNEITLKGQTIKTKTGSFGWKKLGKSTIHFDEKQNEYIYVVEEPNLSERENLLKKKLIYLFQIHTDVDVSSFTETDKRDHLLNILENIIESNKIKITDNEKNKIFYYILQEFIGYGKIDILMKDQDIEDISCDGSNIPLFVFHRKYESLKTNIIYNDEDELDAFVFKLAQLCGKQLSIYEPIVDGRLPDGDRLQTTLGKTITKGSTFTIRRFNEDPLTPIDLIENNTISIDLAAYFWMAMEYGVSILFCGGTASGKTTLLNALSLFIPSNFKIVSAEDTREINLPHENWIAGTTRQGFITPDQSKSKHEIDMFDLVKAALRQRPRVIIVGEVRGVEANTMFQAMATGHLSYSTMHASNMQTLIQRLENKPISLPRSLVVSLDIVVFIKSINTVDGKSARRVDSVIEILKLDPESNRLITTNPFSWKSPIQDEFQNNQNSNIMKRIMELRGWNQEILENELDKRKQVLQWMLDNRIRSYKEVGKIISDYSKKYTFSPNRVTLEAV